MPCEQEAVEKDRKDDVILGTKGATTRPFWIRSLVFPSFLAENGDILIGRFALLVWK